MRNHIHDGSKKKPCTERNRSKNINSRLPVRHRRRTRFMLDVLPLDIAIRIATHLCAGTMCDDALTLAELSDQQRLAVTNALANKLTSCARVKEDDFVLDVVDDIYGYDGYDGEDWRAGEGEGWAQVVNVISEDGQGGALEGGGHVNADNYYDEGSEADDFAVLRYERVHERESTWLCRWVNLFQRCIRHVDMSDRDVRSFEWRWTQCMLSTKLKTVELSTQVSICLAAKVMRQNVKHPLESVTWIMKCNEAMLGRNWWMKRRVQKELCHLVETVEIRELKLECVVQEGHECVLADEDFYKMMKSSVMRSGHKLKALGVNPMMNITNLDSVLLAFSSVPVTRTWMMVEKKWQPLRNSVIPILKQLDAVALCCYATGLDFAVEIGCKVKALELRATVPFVLEKELSSLDKCTELLELKVHMDRSEGSTVAEFELLRAVSVMSKLRMLDLSWPCFPREDVIWSWHMKPYYEAFPGILLKMVKCLPELRKVYFYGVRISLRELESILKCLGGRLRVFATGLEDQEESVLERLERVLEILWKYNEHLIELRVGIPDEIWVGGWGKAEFVNCANRVRRIEVMSRWLKMRKPDLTMLNVDMLLRSLKKDLEIGGEVARIGGHPIEESKIEGKDVQPVEPVQSEQQDGVLNAWQDQRRLARMHEGLRR